MGGQPEILSSGPPEEALRGTWWPGSARGGLAVIVALGALLACCAGALAYMTLLAAHRGNMIDHLRTALLITRHRPPSTSAEPGYSSGTVLTFPDKSGGSFSMVAAAIRSRPGSVPLTWLVVYGQHAKPGERYGLLGGACGNENLISYDWSEGTADRHGYLTIVADNLSINPHDSHIWVIVHRLSNGPPLGGIQGPFIGGGSKTFRSSPPC